MVAGESVLGTSIWSKEFRSRSGGGSSIYFGVVQWRLALGVGTEHRVKETSV